MGMSNSINESNRNPLSVFITNRTQAKRAFNKEIGYVELTLRAFTAEARKHFMRELSTGCINSQSIEIALDRYCTERCGSEVYGVMIRDLVRYVVSIVMSEIDMHEHDSKQMHDAQ